MPTPAQRPQHIATATLRRLRRLAAAAATQRGDAVNWLIITLGVAVAAAAVVTVLRPAIEGAGQQIATLLGGG